MQLWKVAPLAGAWIEIGGYTKIKGRYYSRSPCGSVDRNGWIIDLVYATSKSLPCGSVDRNLVLSIHKDELFRRSPCGSVDRNVLNPDSTYPWKGVAPLAGAWIEI